MELKAIKPAGAAFPTGGIILEDFMLVNAAVVAYLKFGGVHERKPGAITAPGVQISGQGEYSIALQFHEPLVTDQVRKVAAAFTGDIAEVRVCLNFQIVSCLSIRRIIANWIKAFETSVFSS